MPMNVILGRMGAFICPNDIVYHSKREMRLEHKYGRNEKKIGKTIALSFQWLYLCGELIFD